ncbi:MULTISPECIES: sugar-binding transcriptional regulator [Megasphaera]|uniref:Putative transcriptional regulator n=1 Tax=Megasphaera vaginalis (ex Srinivasan et al. 2021) TaxID=1111454 RepID=U7UH39_9FIRM|nr:MULTISPECIES: sugar-binding domain-containing protein [Megasphaera]ERT57778.1 putative transcriptional regulator [Megasphaera vaginalis (ex Srinivasan et al. 2021)]
MENNLLDMFQKIAPDVMSTIKERYLLLRHISDAEPVGRRTLATLSGLSERVVRAHVDVLRRSGIVRFTSMGIEMEPEGKRLMPELLECFLRLNNLDDMQERLCQALQLDSVYIVPGNCDDDQTAKEELGRRGADCLTALFGTVRAVAVSGGSTMAAVAAQLPQQNASLTVVPARGGLGNRVKLQANYIAEMIAAKTGGKSHMLHVSDELSAAALKVMMESDEQTKASVTLAQRADVLLYGIGRADVMAARRGFSEAKRRELQAAGAAGEALGCYCNLEGKIVYVTNNVGITLEDIRQHSHVIAVSGGAAKAEAIVSVMRACKRGVLVTDEGAAEKIMTLI